MQNPLKLVGWLFQSVRGNPALGSAAISIENIDTQLGNEILESLTSNGWVVAKQYSPLAFDKGIDFDWYALKKNGHRVDLEWTNWFEWTIKGDEDVMLEIGQRVDEHQTHQASATTMPRPQSE